jgi:hypothetical protein
VHNLLTSKDLEFLLDLVSVYSMKNLHGDLGELNKIVIPPGSVLFDGLQQLIASKKAISSETNENGGISSLTNMQVSEKGMSKQKKSMIGDHTHIIGHRIKKHLDCPPKGFVILSKKGLSWISNINIIVDPRLRKHRFNYQNRGKRSI